MRELGLGLESEGIEASGMGEPWLALRDYFLDLAQSSDIVEGIEYAKKHPKQKTLSLGCYLTRMFPPDPAVTRWHSADWQDILDVIATQYILNDSLIHQFDSMELQPAGKTLNPKYGQLPCARTTLDRRVHLAKFMCKFEEPILVIGDDDLLSVALLEAGFEKVTVMEIDQSVIQQIKNHPAAQSSKLTIMCQDLRSPLPQSMKHSQQMIFIDPYYTTPGVEMFLGAAEYMIRKNDESSILLSIHLMSLLKNGVDKLFQSINDYRMDIISFFPAFNIYPIPRVNQMMVKMVNKFIIRNEQVRSIHNFKYFFSDALLLGPSVNSSQKLTQ